jgi:hypothetical protein
MRKSLLGRVGGTGALLVMGIVVALAAVRQPEAHYPAHSPEGTVATYLGLLQNGQVDSAYALTAMDAGSLPMEQPMSLENFHQQYDQWGQRTHRAVLVRSSVRGQVATVTVDLSSFTGSVFGASDTTNRLTFTLRRHAGGWLITGPAYIWP